MATAGEPAARRPSLSRVLLFALAGVVASAVVRLQDPREEYLDSSGKHGGNLIMNLAERLRARYGQYKRQATSAVLAAYTGGVPQSGSSIEAARKANRVGLEKTIQEIGNDKRLRAVVVGGTSGIGHGIAVRLAEAGADVTIIGRSASRAKEVLADMQREAAVGAQERGSSIPPSPDGFRFVPCDCFLLNKPGGVRDCVKELQGDADAPIDVLVLSQGMGAIQGFTPTQENGPRGPLDEKLTLHVYSRAAFAKHLLPALRKSTVLPGGARVISILSGGVHSEPPKKVWNSDDDSRMTLAQDWALKNAADTAGFYNDLMADALSREAPEVSFFHAAPGVIDTRWGVEMPLPVRILVRGLQKLPFFRTKEDCAEFMLRGLEIGGAGIWEGSSERTEPRAVNRVGGGSGFHLLDEYGLPTPKKLPGHEEARDRVWKHIVARVDGTAP